MAIRGWLRVVANNGGLAGGFAAMMSKPSVALVQTSGFAVAITRGTPPASGLVRLTLAPAFSSLLTIMALIAPLYGKCHAPPELTAGSVNLGFAVTRSSARSLAS